MSDVGDTAKTGAGDIYRADGLERGRDIPGPPASEARFTTPTVACPEPWLWHSTDGDSTEVEVSDLAYGLVRALQPRLCVETGAGFGQTARRIADALRENGHGLLNAVEVDPDRAAGLDEMFADKLVWPVAVVHGSSLDWEPVGLSGRLVEFAWLDSWYEHRVPEFLRLRQWMRPGTVVCFHDTAPGHGAHRIASGRDLRSEVVCELSHWLRLIHLPTPRGVTVAEVIA